jgi:hypothetical protein
MNKLRVAVIKARKKLPKVACQLCLVFSARFLRIFTHELSQPVTLPTSIRTAATSPH